MLRALSRLKQVGLTPHSPLTSAASKMSAIDLDEFAYRQFDDAMYAGTKLRLSKTAFLEKVHAYYGERAQMAHEFGDRPALIDGYAPFCKHIFMPNDDDSIRDGAIAITDKNRPLLKTKYEARKEEELPVLVRYFSSDDVEAPVSQYLDLILYSREQIEKESAAMGRTRELSAAPWRLIGIKGQNVPYEIPMNPITVMRNELISQGGSGVPIDREAYMASVRYWSDHAVVI